MKSPPKLSLLALTTAAFFQSAASAPSAPYPGYLVDGSGTIVRSGTPGQCWHTNEWTPALAVDGCDPVIKPVVLAAAPAPQPAAAASSAPLPIAVAPPAYVAPALVPRSTFSFSAEALFGFDKAVLKPEGKAMLKDLVGRLNSNNYEGVALTGHTDPIGSRKYNQKLSEQRALEVKNYLVAQGVPADRIDATGVGESQPLTKEADCARVKGTHRIACFQADRRVDVTVRPLLGGNAHR
jgi:OOP family OmpA-OmpF porin